MTSSNNLFYYLAALGILVLAALVIHNAWQARRANPRRADPARPDAAPEPRELREPTMDGDPVPHSAPQSSHASSQPQASPAFHAEAAPSAVAHEGETAADMAGAIGDALTQPVHDDAATAASHPHTNAPLAEPTAAPAAAEPWLAPRRTPVRLDALVDAIAVLAVETPISGEMAIAHLPPSRRAGGKPFLIEGLNTDNGQWEPPTAGQRYGEFQAGVLLANRTGALNEIEYSEFVHKVQAFADAIGALPQFPDMLDVVAQARELDAFASQHDAQLAVRLQATVVAWSVGYIHQQAAKHGFVSGAVPGRMVMPSSEDGAPPILVLTYDPQAALAEDPNQAAVRHLTLSFDVPQTDAAARPFESWRKAAQGLAADTEAAIVDDNGRPIASEGFEQIGAELTHLYDAMDARGLAAGSPAARQLFS